MSLKITNVNGFTIGGILNPSITEIYVRVLCDMTKQNISNESQIEIRSQAKTTQNGGLFDNSIQVDFINPLYWLKYNINALDMNAQYLELEEDLKSRLITDNPEWENSIEIVSLGAV